MDEKLWGPSCSNRDYYLSLANDMQQSNRKLHFRIECKQSPFDKSNKSIQSTKSYETKIIF